MGPRGPHPLTARRPGCSPKIRRGGSRQTSPSCPNCYASVRRASSDVRYWGKGGRYSDDPKRTLTASDFNRLNPLQTSTGLRHSMPTVRIGRHVAQLDFQRVSDCGGIRSELVCGKRRPHQWSPCNAKHARPGISVRYRQRVCGGEEPAIDEALGNDAE
jgi:hypothetical protein